MSKLILGTVQFGLDYGINNKNGKPAFVKVKEILDFAYVNGIQLLDTAEAYGNAQERIGEYHYGSSNVFKIITKFSPLRTDLPSNINERVKHNLNTLNVENLYGYMFHSYKDFKYYFNSFKEELLLMKDNGFIQKIGVSLHSNEEIEEVLNYEEIELIQLPFNLLDNNNQRKEVLMKAKEKGVEIHTRSVFLQGLFFKDIEELKGNLKVLKSYLIELSNLTSENIKMNDIALSYAFKQPFIDSVLIGVDSNSQLDYNLESILKKLPISILDTIDLIKVKEKELLNPVNWK